MGTLSPKDPDYIYLAPSKEVVIADRARPYDVKVLYFVVVVFVVVVLVVVVSVFS